MPLTILTAEQQAAARAALDDEFDCALEDKNVPILVRLAFSHVGVTKVAVSARIEDKVSEFREMLKSDSAFKAMTPTSKASDPRS